MRIRQGGFTVALRDGVDPQWVDRLLGAVRQRYTPGRREYFRHPLPEEEPGFTGCTLASVGGSGQSDAAGQGDAFVKIYARRRAHNVLRRLRAGRAVREAAGYKAFHDAGAPTADLIAWGEERRAGLWRSGLVVTRFVNAPNAFEILARTRATEILEEGARFLSMIHRKGLVHGDAGLTNFLMSERGMLAIDLSDWRPATARARLTDAARMAGSAVAAGMGPDEPEAFLERYLSNWGERERGPGFGPRADQGAPVDRAAFVRQARRFAAEDTGRLLQAKPIGSRRSHDTLRRLLESEPPGRVLDAPCGEGVLAEFLRAHGWDVQCADIDPGLLKIRRAPMTAVDLNRALPFESASFDAVVCANALHRLYNPGGAISEFFRILRPGGRLFLNINNYSSIRKRLRFLIYGSLDNALNDGGCQQTIDAPEAHVRVALLTPQLIKLLWGAGFQVREVHAAARDGADFLARPAAWAVKLMSFLAPPRSRGRNVLSLANSDAILGGGRYAVITAVKA